MDIFLLCRTVGERSDESSLPTLELCASCTVELVPPSRALRARGSSPPHHPRFVPPAEYPDAAELCRIILNPADLRNILTTAQPHTTLVVSVRNSNQKRKRAAHLLCNAQLGKCQNVSNTIIIHDVIIVAATHFTTADTIPDQYDTFDLCR